MQSRRGRVRNERGSTLALIAVMLFGMLALAALAIDLASLRDARSEAQRSADAVALAGASAFRDLPWTDPPTITEAGERAFTIARLNMVRSDTIDIRDSTWQDNTYGWGSVRVWQTASNELELNIIPDSQKVRAWVRHAGVSTFFGGLLGVPWGHVQARATAWATTNGPTVNCLKPFVMPDMWYESDKITQDFDPTDNYMNPITTVVGNEQDGESWKYQPASIGGEDYYRPAGGADPDGLDRPETGYGSPMRQYLEGGVYPQDIGLPLLLKPQTGSGNTNPAAERMGSAFWMLDLDTLMDFKTEVLSGCASASVGDSVPYDHGSKTAVRQPINTLVQQDPDAVWDNATHQVVGSRFADWTQSPRVVIVALIDPKYWIANSSNTKPDPGSKFTNFVRIFFEPIDPTGPPTNIHARYIGPAPGSGGPTGGPLVKILQLIE